MITYASFSQDIQEREKVPVKNLEGMYYSFPWAGGMNSCQFGKVDLDMDGVRDLVVFDRTGDRLMPFLNTGTKGEINYQHTPHLVENFPSMHDWMILVDYDKDGREDIFTYSPGYAGMIVYRNVSTTELAFERIVYPYLTSFQGGGYVNILVTYVDYPGIVDLDGDGDLDILTFWGLGSFVEMHKNLSYEKYGNYDSLDFEKTEICWGYFAESEESNELTLDTCVGWKPQPLKENLLPHTGSTFLVMDLDGDQVKDLLLGDVDYPNLVALYNDGTNDSTYMGSYELFFPSYGREVFLYSLPVAASLDIDNDGVNDLLVSPFDPNPALCANKHSSWLYLNTGTNEMPYYAFNKDDFLQDQMIDVGAGSYPAVADYNGDGLPDLFIGNYGYYDSSYLDQNLLLHTEHTGKIALYQNIGSPDEPAFTYITDDLAGLSSLDKKGLVPSFADLDGDGDPDMVCGYEDGKVCLLENMAGSGQPMELQLLNTEFESIDVGDYSAVQLFDLDRDGVTDLIVGERKGNINFYKGSQGDPWMEFSLVTDSLGKINVTDPNLYLDGYSVPHFFRDEMDHTLLLVGSRQGEIYFYNNIDDNLTGEFALSDTLADYLGLTELNTDRGYLTSAIIYDFNQDNAAEMLAGNFSGGLEYISSSGSPQVSGIDHLEATPAPVSVYPNPSRGKIMVEISSFSDLLISGIEMLDLRGSIVLQKDGRKDRSMELELSGLTPGLYIMKIILFTVNNTYLEVYEKVTIL